MNCKLLFISTISVSLLCCGKRGASDKAGKDESIQTVLPTEETKVRTETLRTVDFEHQLVSNGRLGTQQAAELQFESLSAASTPIRIYVKNGDRVSVGTPIAILDTFLLSNNMRTAEDNLQKAFLDYQDALIGMGYPIENMETIPSDAKNLANIRSGYNTARHQHELARHNFDKATLRAPISGTITDLFAKPYCTIDASVPFCKIINNSQLEVDFNILENELPLINRGDKVEIQSYASPDIRSTGHIANINPSVGKDGTVRIRANVHAHPKLFNGMNVRISVFRSVGKQWVVPKSAVVLRTGKQVVFTYKNGAAGWNYVSTGLENATHYTITSETLHEGDDIIISGNEHLADGTKVVQIDD